MKRHVKSLCDYAEIVYNFDIPIGSMYGIFTYMYHNNQHNVGKYTIHGSYGIRNWSLFKLF